MMTWADMKVCWRQRRLDVADIQEELGAFFEVSPGGPRHAVQAFIQYGYDIKFILYLIGRLEKLEKKYGKEAAP